MPTFGSYILNSVQKFLSMAAHSALVNTIGFVLGAGLGVGSFFSFFLFYP